MPTWDRAPSEPFGAQVKSIQLASDAIVSTVAQVRFAPVLRIGEQAFVAPFQDAIRTHYPLAQKEIQQQVAPGAEGDLVIAESVVWRFTDLTDSWQVTLSEEFVALSCSDYSNRTDFMARFRQVLEAIADHIKPVVSVRIGIRYIDRIDDAVLIDQLPNMVRPALLGFAGTSLGSALLESQLAQADFVVDGVSFRGRWGQLPAGATHEPTVVPTANPSWLLDLDAFTGSMVPFDANGCAQETERYAAIIYGFFRWAVSDQFLEAHGAES